MGISGWSRLGGDAVRLLSFANRLSQAKGLS